MMTLKLYRMASCVVTMLGCVQICIQMRIQVVWGLVSGQREQYSLPVQDAAVLISHGK